MEHAIQAKFKVVATVFAIPTAFKPLHLFAECRVFGQ
jgi:hypothetical protein